MKQKFIKVGGMVLLIFLISSLLTILASAGVMAGITASPSRVLPAVVYPGDEFQVTVTFTSPAVNFTAIGLADLCPAGWTVSVNKTWNTPAADVDNHPTPDEVDYIWFGPYAASVGFTAVYNVQVPCNATPGYYDFTDGTLEYYINGAGPYTENITGDYQVEVAQTGWAANSGGTNTTSFTTSATVYAAGSFPGSETIDIYVVNASDCSDVINEVPNASIDCGQLSATPVWSDPLTPGTWDLVFDVDKSGSCPGAGDVVAEFTVTSGPTPAPVGGTAYPINKLPIIALLSALGAAIIAGIVILERRRRTQS